MDTLTVRIYNVRFGDGILISVPDKDENNQPLTRYILIDVGNVASGEGGENEIFKPVFDDILKVLNGRPLDLYVLTHEHLDHVQGPLWAERFGYQTESLKAKLNVQHAWLPASSALGYYESHTNARKKLEEASAAYFAIDRFLAASDIQTAESIAILMRNNNRFLPVTSNFHELSHGRTADCVEYIRSLAESNTHYIHRTVGAGINLYDLSDKHPFMEAEFEIWAPEEDSSDYYGRFQPMALSEGNEAREDSTLADYPTRSMPPSGVDAGDFYNLVRLRGRGYIDNLLAIDKAANNSSIVFCLKWRGWKLLFAGDSEIRSWKEMDKEGALGPVNFFKISHHESHNGTPADTILRKVFPSSGPNTMPRTAAASTYLDTYPGIPHEEITARLISDYNCKVLSTLKDIADGELALKIDFPDFGQSLG